MPAPQYIIDLRRCHGHDLLLLPAVSAVVVLGEPSAERILLVQRSDTGRWSLPAGIVEPGEQPAAAMIRELYEETRVVAQAERLALLVTDPEQVYPNGDRCQFISMCFRCSYLSGDPIVGDEESTAVGWFPVSDLPAGVSARDRRRIACAMPPEGPTVFDQ